MSVPILFFRCPQTIVEILGRPAGNFDRILTRSAALESDVLFAGKDCKLRQREPKVHLVMCSHSRNSQPNIAGG